VIELPGIDERLLTPMLKRLIRCLGVAKTLVLLRARGGIPVKLPQSADGFLAEMLGVQELAALLAEFGPGSRITLPVVDKIDAQIRDAAIRMEHARGDSLADIALRYKMTMRHVQNICRAPPPLSKPSPQSALF
jgi:hypothetical protein